MVVSGCVCGGCSWRVVCERFPLLQSQGVCVWFVLACVCQRIRALALALAPRQTGTALQGVMDARCSGAVGCCITLVART